MIGPAGFGQAPNTGVGRGLSSAERHVFEPGAPSECPKCGALQEPRSFRKDGSVTYSCSDGRMKHRPRYTWRIGVDGSLIDVL